MKSEKLMEALGEIDERCLLAVQPDHLKPRKHRWPVALAAAAMVGLCIFGIGKLDGTIPPKQDDIAEQLSQWTQPELNKLLWDHAGEADRAQLNLSELWPFSKFLCDNQRVYEELLTQEGLHVYLKRVGAKSVCVLDAPELGQLVRLQCGMDQVVIDCTTPSTSDWRKSVDAAIQTMLDDAASGMTEQEEAEGAKAAFGSWFQRNGPAPVDWKAIHGQMQKMKDHSVKLSVMQEEVRLLELNWYGGDLVEVCWPEQRDETWYSAYQNTEISVEDAVYFLYERDPDQQKSYFTHWLNFLREAIPADAELAEPLTARLAVPILKQFTIEKVDRFAIPSDLPNSSDECFTRAEFEKTVEELETQRALYPDRNFEDVDVSTWYYGAQMYATNNRYLASSSPTTFEPEAPISRGDLAGMLYRAAIKVCELDPWGIDREAWVKEYPGGFSEYDLEDQTPMTVEEVIGIFFRYTDQVLGWKDLDHTEPMNWAGYHGLLTNGDGPLVPQQVVTRVQAVHMLRQLMNEPYYPTGVPQYYEALPDGTVICTEPMTAQTELDAVQKVTETYMTQFIQRYYNLSEADLKQHTVLELQERNSLPASVMEQYRDAVQAGLEIMELYKTKVDLAAELREGEKGAEDLEVSYILQEITQHEDFAFVKMMQGASFRYPESETESGSQMEYGLTLLRTEEGWFVLSLENRP